MSDFLAVLGIALLPVLGNALGSLTAELTRTPRWVTGAALHAAAGVAIAVVSVDLMPRALVSVATWLIVALFALGAAVSVLMARSVSWLRGSRRGGGPWMVYAATAFDLLSDGLMTGAGSAVSRSLGLVLALSQVVANFPGGFATVANFRDHGIPRSKRMLAVGSFALPVICACTVGYWLLRGADPQMQSASLCVIAGVLLVTTVEDLVPEADAPGTARWLSTASFVIGFCSFALLSGYVD